MEWDAHFELIGGIRGLDVSAALGRARVVRLELAADGAGAVDVQGLYGWLWAGHGLERRLWGAERAAWDGVIRAQDTRAPSQTNHRDVTRLCNV